MHNPEKHSTEPVVHTLQEKTYTKCFVAIKGDFVFIQQHRLITKNNQKTHNTVH